MTSDLRRCEIKLEKSLLRRHIKFTKESILSMLDCVQHRKDFIKISSEMSFDQSPDMGLELPNEVWNWYAKSP